MLCTFCDGDDPECEQCDGEGALCSICGEVCAPEDASHPECAQNSSADEDEDPADAVDPGPAPDIDGELGKGWRVFTETWGHVAGRTCAVVAVQACHAMYGT